MSFVASLKRRDVRKNPFKALSRRVWWRIRWIITKRPWVLTLCNGMTLTAPRGGAGALIYYQGASEPEVSALLRKLLQTGMTFWDVGSHIGEYALLASTLVGSKGRVEAFEPQPRMFAFLRDNVARNDLHNVDVHDIAITSEPGKVWLTLPVEPSIAFVSVHESNDLPTVEVTCAPLDLVRDITGSSPNVIKVDVEGAEMLVLNGSTGLLNLPPEQAPIWIMEYEPENCTRFDYKSSDLLATFRASGYFTYWLAPDAETELILESTQANRTIVATKGPKP